MNECPVCRIPLGRYETCPSPACPCYGLRSDSPEAETAAERWRSRPSIAAARTMTGDDALAHLDRLAMLELMELRSNLIDLEIEHASL